MGALIKVVDAALFIFFLIIAIAAPLLDGQSILPTEIYPPFLVDLKNWYVKEYDDYLMSEKPLFFRGLIWLEIFFQWPLALICLYGIVAAKSWLPTTCLMYGTSIFTAMVAILSELTGSGRGSDALLKMYYPFLAFAVLAILRGVLSGKSAAIGKRSGLKKKRV